MTRPFAQLGFGIAALCLALGAARASADVVIDWNVEMTHYNESLPPPGTPPLEERIYAIAHIAMFNAAGDANRNHASAEAAAAQAAHDVLARSLPAGTADFDALLARELAAVPDGAGKAAGIQAGSAAAAAELAARAGDGIGDTEGPYHPGSKPGDYQYTAPFDKIAPPGNPAPYAHLPKLGKVTPFVLKAGDQFRAKAPYSVNDAEYSFDFNEVKALGGRNSTARTADQTAMAQFWYEDANFTWNRIARGLAAQHPEDLLETARLFAALNAAIFDAYVAGFDSKYAQNLWRPVTAIHSPLSAANPATVPDPTWESLMLTPPMPDYVSTHSASAAAASVVLIWFFHGDEQTFTIPSTMAAMVPGLKPRTFHRISDAAEECAFSRVFAGIHFRRSCLAGLEQGRSVGAWVVQHAAFTEGR
jgi:hypothetical protein